MMSIRTSLVVSKYFWVYEVSKIICLSLFVMSSLFSSVVFGSDNSRLLEKFRDDILDEIYRSHGDEIEMSAVLSWCGLNELSDEVSLSGNAMKRAVYDSFVVSGTKNIKAIEIVRKMDEAYWRRFNSSIYHGLDQYRSGFVRGISYVDVERKVICDQSEENAFKKLRVILK